MNEKTIATIALRNSGYRDLQAVFADAAQLLELAAFQGADLAVLPETINLFHGSGESTPFEDFALDDWQQSASILLETARRCQISVVLPLLVRDNGALANRFYVVSRDGQSLGHYQKLMLAPGERLSGLEPGVPVPVQWEGLKLGGAICIDVYYPQRVFEPQVQAGADFFVIPSLTPAGCVLDSNALVYGVPTILAYSPWNRILDRDSKELAAGGTRWETVSVGFASRVVQATINFDAVTLFADRNQERLRDVQKHYGRKVRIRFDQHNCVFVLESRAADLSVSEIMREFGLVSRRDYFTQQGPRFPEAEPQR